MDGWRLNLTFDAAHFIADYSKCSRLHGHEYAVSIVIKGEAKNGIVVDFVAVKNEIKKIIEELDHRVIIPTMGEIEVNEKGDEIEVKHMNKRFIFPKEDCILLPIQSSSAENLASYILKKFLDNFKMPDNVEEVGVGVDEGHGQGAWEWRKIK